MSMDDKDFCPPEGLTPAAPSPDDTIRPSRLADFIGQDDLRGNLKVFLRAALEQGRTLDHSLLYGPPGLGKTTLAQIMASELGVNLVQTTGPVLERCGDLAAIVTNLRRGDILFIDEIHRMPAAVEEILYPAMEDFKLDLIIGQGPGARTVRIDLEPFTLVGATTRLGLLTSPLRDRFGVIFRLEFYRPEELARIVTRAAGILAMLATTFSISPTPMAPLASVPASLRTAPASSMTSMALSGRKRSLMCRAASSTAARKAAGV